MKGIGDIMKNVYRFLDILLAITLVIAFVIIGGLMGFMDWPDAGIIGYVEQVLYVLSTVCATITLTMGYLGGSWSDPEI